MKFRLILACVAAWCAIGPAPAAPPGKGPLREYVRGPIGAIRESLRAEAKAALAPVLTAEQVYYSTHGHYRAVKAGDAGAALGVDSGPAAARWVIAVRAASMGGYVASAVGRKGTPCEGVSVSARHVRGRADTWTER